MPLWLSASKLGNSKLFQSSAGKVGIGTTTPVANLDVNGTVNAATGYSLGGKSYGPFNYAFSGCDSSGLAAAIKPLITDRCDQYAFLMVPRTTGW